MEQKLQKLHTLKSLSLSQEERGLIRTHAAKMILEHEPKTVPSLFFRGVQHGLRIALSAMFFVVFVGGSVSAIADSALPGDPLYTFKINVNEEVKGAFLKTPEEKVVWQKNRIENRIKEINTLADSNTLTTQKQEKAKQALSIHVEELSKELTALSDVQPDAALTVTASLEQSLKASRGNLEARNTSQASLMMAKTMTADEAPQGDTGIAAALKTVDEALNQVSKQEVKIISKEIDNISKDMTSLSESLSNNAATSSVTLP